MTNLKQYNSKMAVKFIFAILLSVAFVVGIPLIIFGAKNNTVLMVLGIVMVVFGFYGAPMVWISYAEGKKYQRILHAIEVDKITNVEDLAVNFNLSIEEMQKTLQTMTSKGILTGRVIRKEKVEKVKTEKESFKCPNCGAMLDDSTKSVCEYCGEKIR